MIVVVGELSAVYAGRGETHLAPYKRIVMVKNDGSVSIHGEKGFKPMNYMTAAKGFEESQNSLGEKVWTFATKKESLTVTFHEIYEEINLDLGNDDPGHSSKLGQEKQLQEWLVTHLSLLWPDLTFKEREFQTGSGPVDLLVEDEEGAWVALEVKRTTTLNTVGQVLRYVDALKAAHGDKTIKAAIAAVEFKPSTRTLAATKGVRCLEVPETWAASYQEDHQALEKAQGVKIIGALPLPPQATLLDLASEAPEEASVPQVAGPRKRKKLKEEAQETPASSPLKA